MTEQTENLILEHLRAIRARLDGMEVRLEGIETRLAAIEAHQAGDHLGAVHANATFADHEKRIRHIERRLELHNTD